MELWDFLYSRIQKILVYRVMGGGANMCSWSRIWRPCIVETVPCVAAHFGVSDETDAVAELFGMSRKLIFVFRLNQY